jgi:hypothetical protein
MKRYRRKILFFVLVAGLLIGFHYIMRLSPVVASFYNSFIFRPFQSIRNLIFGWVPFSVGDVIYVGALLGIAFLVLRWFYYLFRCRRHSHLLLHSLIRGMIVASLVYVVFFLGWGGNYYRTDLSRHWGLDSQQQNYVESLAAYDAYLVQQLNRLAPVYKSGSFEQTDTLARRYYRDYTDSRTRLYGLKAKSSLFGYWMQYLGIQGYYNPFTGEAQVNHYLPAFMLPFVVCHEMAHQSGIAAEDDANLLAYALCTAAPDTAFRYSAYFNLWLYTHNRLMRTDSIQAKALLASLNDLSRTQLDTLRDIRSRFRSDLSRYSGKLYDRYLRLHHQDAGIESYSHVALTAWQLEQRRRLQPDSVIRIP